MELNAKTLTFATLALGFLAGMVVAALAVQNMLASNGLG